MLIRFFGGHGTGSSSRITNYLIDPDHNALRNEVPPEVLRGDLMKTGELIDCIDRKWKYTTGVISFAIEDAPTWDQQNEVMDRFENLAFAGLDPEQYDITWVRHAHTHADEGIERVELHFLTPRMELSTGKALNVAPPGWERIYAPLRDYFNYEYNWARPDDPNRSREPHLRFERDDRAKAIESLTNYIDELIVHGAINDHDEMIARLKQEGFEIPRAGKNYFTILDPETNERYRMKGAKYDGSWTREAELARAAESKDGQSEPDDKTRREHRERARLARDELADIIRIRGERQSADYRRHLERDIANLAEARYDVDRGMHRDLSRDASPHSVDGEPQFGRQESGERAARDDHNQLQDSASQRDRSTKTIAGGSKPSPFEQFGNRPSQREHKLRNERERDRSVSEGGLENRKMRVDERQQARPLHSEELEHGAKPIELNALGKSALTRAREAYERLKAIWNDRDAILERARNYAQNIIDGVRDHFSKTERNRNTLREFDQNLGRSEHLNGKLDHASEQALERAQKLENAHEATLDRGRGLEM